MTNVTKKQREFIRRMPKAELHVHLEGSIYPDTLIKLASKHGRQLPFSTEQQARDWFRFRDFPHFIEVYVEICNCLLDEDDYELVTVDMAKRAHNQNLKYLEVTFAPVSILNPRTTAVPDVVIRGMRSGATIAARDYGVDMRFILDPVRGRPIEDVTASAQWWVENAGDRLVGFGLGGLELGNPATRYIDAFDLVRSADARISIHAGETDGPASVRDAINSGAERIGHGVRAIEDPQLVAEIVDRNLMLEVSPTSNIQLGVYPSYADHPFRQLADAGVTLSLNSDDPPMFDTSLTREFEILVEHFDYSLTEVVELTKTAIQHSFLDPPDRLKLVQQFDEENQNLAAELGIDLL